MAARGGDGRTGAVRRGAGDGTLDLSRLDVPAERTVATRVDVGMGRIQVVVPGT